jgi:ABC-type multidrug transport system ATPase subunit
VGAGAPLKSLVREGVRGACAHEAVVRSLPMGSKPDTIQPSISLRDVSRRRGETQVLDRVSFEHDGPGVIGLVGRNGAGKTSLLRVIAQLLCPDSGDIAVCGQAFEDGENAAARRLVGFAPHEPLLRRSRSLRDNLLLSARLAGIGSGAATVTDRELERWQLGRFAKRNIEGLSRGELQRVALAQADIAQPPVLLLDEPTTGLDAEGMELLDGAIERWRTDRLVIVSSHDRDWIDATASWTLNLDEVSACV